MTIPDVVTKTGSRGADIGVTVVVVDTPRLQNTVGIPFMSWASNVISNFVVSLFLDRFANSGRDIIEDFVPSNTLPFSFTTFSRTLQRVENTIRVVDLVDRRWTFRTISTATSGVIGITFEFADLIRIFVDVCRQPTRAFTIETGRGNN